MQTLGSVLLKCLGLCGQEELRAGAHRSCVVVWPLPGVARINFE